MPNSIPHAFQRGQAMVEYAIILIVMTLLVAGGLELALAAYNGHRTVESAKAGASTWAGFISNAVFNPTNNALAPFDKSLGIIVGLGEHPSLNNAAIQNFRRPSCVSATDYDDGLPDGSVDPDEQSITQGGNKVYLYNPLPLDITACLGADADYPNRSRVSVLVAGKRDNPGTATVENEFAGLPKLNQAAYSQYEKAFVDEGAAPSPVFMSIRDYNPANPSHVQLLRLPGWLDITIPEAMSELVRLDGGVYASVPTFALKCRNSAQDTGWQDCDSASSPSGLCWDNASTPSTTPLACDVQVQYRYRHIFESLVMMGVGTGYDAVTDESPVDENIDGVIEPLFSNEAAPSGVLGSELAETKVVNERALASRLKAKKDFVGCYETASQGSAFQTPIASASATGNVITITTSTIHSFSVGNSISVSGVHAEYDGVFRIIGVTGSSFSYETAIAPATMSVTPAAAFAISVIGGVHVISADQCNAD